MKSLSKFLPIVTCMLLPLFAYSAADISYKENLDCCVDECTDDPGVDVLEIGPDCEHPENQLICVKPGDVFDLQLCQRNLDQLVRGYQVFMCFDPEALQVVGIVLTDDPYAKHIRKEWDNVAGTINLARGIDDGADPPQQPTQADALLGVITFQAIAPACPKNDDGTIGTLVCMRDNLPPTRFSDEDGYPVYPCVRFTRVRIDELGPEITQQPQGATFECGDPDIPDEYQAWLDNHGGATAKDNCTPEDELEWSYEVVDYVEGCCETWYADVKFIVTDCSLNSRETVTVTFTVEDTTAPDITVQPQDARVECDPAVNQDQFQEWLDNRGGAEATDICCDPNDLTWSYEIIEQVQGCCDTWYADVMFTVTDDCNNAASALETARFTVEDTTPPVIDPPAQDAREECDDSGFQEWLDDHGGARATDVCCDPNELTWSYDDYVWVDDCCDTGYADVTFRVCDDCGNCATTTARYTSEDTTPPEITVPAQDMTVECDPN
ncbi:MAG TPA: cohesin domain-containing protein, partial [Phycisphaerae bacterium]|nr:cohesin domain-containing protein [Phycisphaerae bacterium]